MLSLAHTLISIPFGIYLENPIIIFLAAATFHFFCDTLLHWNVYPDKYQHYPYGHIAVDVLGGVAVAWLLTGNEFFTLPILAAITGGNFPDIAQAPWEWISPKNKKKFPKLLKIPFHWHDQLQLETPDVFIGMISQLILITVSILLIL